MTDTKTVQVPHLGGIQASYRLSHPYDPTKPTLILINSFMTSSALYHPQFTNTALTSTANLLAIELLGHGQTRTHSENFTYWDTAIMSLQVMTALDIPNAFVLGTSQGGWVAVRMALLAPERIRGLILLGTSTDYESQRTKELGCWDGVVASTGLINEWTTKSPTPDFELNDGFCNFLVDSGFGSRCSKEQREFWIKTTKDNYRGDDGRRRARMAAINLRERDGLHGRLWDVKCPVLWLHGTEDQVYSLANAEHEITLFVNSKEARVEKVEGGAHFLSASNPEDVDGKVVEFLRRWRGESV